MNNQKGFSILELIIVLAALSIITSIIVVAINPGKQLADTRDSQRWTDLEAILDAVYEYSDDNELVPDSIPNNDLTEICKTGETECGDLVDLSVLTNDGTYLLKIPEDPTSTSEKGTGYFIYQMETGAIQLSAPNAENETIQGYR